MRKPLLIAIDGPAASGKGTLAKKLAEHYRLEHMDTGKLYRAVGLRMLMSDTSYEDVGAAIEFASNLTLDALKDRSLTEEKVGEAASIVSAMPEVRKALLAFQHHVASSSNGAVLDGRDIGTVVCPNADIKLFITADVETRADRRYKELQLHEKDVTYDTVLRDLVARDERDSNREIAPLVPAEDAVIIDTTDMQAEEAFANVTQLIDQRLSA